MSQNTMEINKLISLVEQITTVSIVASFTLHNVTQNTKALEIFTQSYLNPLIINVIII